MVVRTIAPLSVAKVAGVLYALMGLVFGALFALAALAGAFEANEDAGVMGTFLGVWAIVALPMFYGCLGFVFTLVGAWLYIGGIELNVS